MNLIEKYNLESDINFVNIELDKDNKMFVDPYLLYISKTDIGVRSSNRIVGYFEELLDCARNGKEKFYV